MSIFKLWTKNATKNSISKALSRYINSNFPKGNGSILSIKILIKSFLRAEKLYEKSEFFKTSSKPC